MASAVVIAVGDELLAGSHPDLNSPVVGRRLLDLGLPTERVIVVGDDVEQLARAVGEAMGAASIVVVTGGLGPTLDDLTRHAIADAAGLELVRSEDALRRIRAWYAERGIPMPELNERQALVPRGATILHNSEGTAPGFRIEIDRSTVFALPGPPFEMVAMLESEVVPWALERAEGHPVEVARFHLFGLSESVFAEGVGPWMERGENPVMGVTVAEGILTVVLRARGGTQEERREILEGRAVELRGRFARHLFSEETPAIEQVVGRKLIEEGITVTTAESCTGGLAAALLTRVPGISAVLREAVVVYGDGAKTRLLGVGRELLERHGAVSREVAEAMARGAAERGGARAAIAITGIAGPGGGTEEKPVGLVWLGLSLDGVVTTHRRRLPPNDRNRVRLLAAKTGLFLLLRRLGGLD